MPSRSVSDLVLDHIEGFILNLFTEYRLGPFTLPYSRRHWIALRRLRTTGLPSGHRGVYYNLDSKLPAPERIGTVRLGKFGGRERKDWCSMLYVFSYIKEEILC